MLPKAKQIWRDRDPRRTRFIRVIEVYESRARIMTCSEEGNPLPGARDITVSLAAFFNNSKVRGFKWHREEPIERYR
jgi:hypothetical protein